MQSEARSATCFRLFGGGSLKWLIYPTPSIVCLPYYLKFLMFLLCLLMVDLVMRLLDLFWVINCFLYICVVLLHSCHSALLM